MARPFRLFCEFFTVQRIRASESAREEEAWWIEIEIEHDGGCHLLLGISACFRWFTKAKARGVVAVKEEGRQNGRFFEVEQEEQEQEQEEEAGREAWIIRRTFGKSLISSPPLRS